MHGRPWLVYNGTLVSAGKGGALLVWELTRQPTLLGVLNGHSLPSAIYEIMDDLIISTDEHNVRVWNLASGDYLQIFVGHNGGAGGALLNGKSLVTSDKHGLVKFGDLEKE